MGKRINIILVLLLFVPFCKVSETTDTDTVSKWSLWSSGTQLRGINIWQKKIDREVDEDFLGAGKFGPPYTKNDFEKLKLLGTNYVNISHPGIYSVEQPYVVDEDAIENLKGLIAMIGDVDMFAVISFRTGPGRSEYTFYRGEDFQSDSQDGWFDEKYYNDKVWESEIAKSGWVAMWKRAAEEFKDNSIVVGYDLMVEPNSTDVFFDIYDPEDFYPEYAWSSYDWNIFFPDIVSGIREIDPEIPIIVGGLSYSDIQWLPFINIIPDTKTIYSFHQYSPHVYTHQSKRDKIGYPEKIDVDWDSIPDDFNRDWLTNLINIGKNFMDDNNVRIAVNEYGGVRWAGNLKDFLNDEMELFESHGINYAIWAWSSEFEPYRSEVDGFNYLMGPDPENKSDLDNNELINVLKKYWSKNTARPSNTNFK